jgi:cytochrome c553
MTWPDRIFVLSAAILMSTTAFAAEFPAWAYPVSAPDEAPPTDDGRPLRVPDSSAAFTRSQLEAIDGPVSDWHPGEHPPMPAIVGRGRSPAVYACAYCHLPNGAGRPENASLDGLTAAYIKQQIQDFRHGSRPGSEPKRLPQTAMIAIAQAATDREIAEAASYFASLKPASFVRVVETATVPKTVVYGWALVQRPGGGTEPIAGRIIEMPADVARFENRDSRTPYVAYVPVGSIRLGAHLAATGVGGLTVKCAVCHGPDLRGLGDIPRLSGRSPSYLVRQLHDLRSGKRTGGTSDLMKLVAAKMTDGDIVALAAYLASRKP